MFAQDGMNHLVEQALNPLVMDVQTIISNKGGLPETTSDALILKENNSTNLYILIKKLIINSKLRRNLQKKSNKNFYLTNTFVSKQIDDIRDKTDK